MLPKKKITEMRHTKNAENIRGKYRYGRDPEGPLPYPRQEGEMWVYLCRNLLPRTRTAPARAATVIRLSHRPIAASSAVLGLSVPLLPVLPPLLALGSAGAADGTLAVLVAVAGRRG